LNFNESQEAIFISLIDQLSVLHIRILKVFQEGFLWSNHDKIGGTENDVPGHLVANIGSYNGFMEVDRILISARPKTN